jgi:hypothetical protein
VCEIITFPVAHRRTSVLVCSSSSSGRRVLPKALCFPTPPTGRKKKEGGKKSADLSKEGADLSVLKVLDPGRWRQASSWPKKGVKARVTLVVQRHRLSGWRTPPATSPSCCLASGFQAFVAAGAGMTTERVMK